MASKKTAVQIDDRELMLSNLDKVLYPEADFTKAAVLDYYARIAEVMIPHLAARPVTLRRYPDGVSGETFFEKQRPSHAPDWVRSMRVASRSGRQGRDFIDYPLLGDRPSLVWAANLAAIELHVPLWHRDGDAEPPTPPDHLVFDFDPGPGTNIVECCRIALLVRDRLRNSKSAVAKTSGSKGLQVYAPRAGASWDDIRDEVLGIAKALEQDHPDQVVVSQDKKLREGRVLIDWSQNHPAKTTVAVYSLRATAYPTASTPVTWDEVERCAAKRDATLLRFLAPDVLRRVDEHGDLFAPLLPKRPRAKKR
ncbi:MAG TPA: non-homologous end-joining DNA ligase [Mycobacteriales bacterium]|nr:non-homologous end-joining DNA ligase [Mycobacteriales bacterium]